MLVEPHPPTETTTEHVVPTMSNVHEDPTAALLVAVTVNVAQPVASVVILAGAE